MRTKNMVMAKTMYVCDKKKRCSASEACQKGICCRTSDIKHALYSDHMDDTFDHMINPVTKQVTIWERIRKEETDE